MFSQFPSKITPLKTKIKHKTLIVFLSFRTLPVPPPPLVEMGPATPAQSAQLTGQSGPVRPPIMFTNYSSVAELPAGAAPHHSEFVVSLRRAVTAAQSLRTQLTSPPPPGNSAQPASSPYARSENLRRKYLHIYSIFYLDLHGCLSAETGLRDLRVERPGDGHHHHSGPHHGGCRDGQQSGGLQH